MAASLLALLDDIASVLDDVALMTKVAARKSAAAVDDVAVLTKLSAQKTAGVLGDDLALNAQQVAGVRADRELPVVWGVAKGSLVNKAILVPAALAISALAPWLVTPLLMAGGAFLCFEGAEKLAHRFLGGHEKEHEAAPGADARAETDLAALEKAKVKGAVRTDFVLSAEIIAITLGNVTGQPLPTQLAVLAGVALIMTAGVYGLVAAIVKPARQPRRAGGGPRHLAPGPVADEAAHGGRHRRHVSGRRRHPRSRRARAAPPGPRLAGSGRPDRRAAAAAAGRRRGPGYRGLAGGSHAPAAQGAAMKKGLKSPFFPCLLVRSLPPGLCAKSLFKARARKA